MLTGCGDSAADSRVTEKPVELKVPETKEFVELKIPEDMMPSKESSVEEVAEASIETVIEKEPSYTVKISGSEVTGTIDEIVDAVNSSYENGDLAIVADDDVYFSLSMSSYSQLYKVAPEQLEECVREFFVEAENKNAENAFKEKGTAKSNETLESEEISTEPDVTVEQIIEENIPKLKLLM